MSRTNKNTKTAIVFPGIGVELCGRESTLFSQYKSVYSPFFAEGSKAARTDLSRALTTDTVSQLGELENQIFIYCFSVGTYHLLRQKNILPDLFGGYSFGIYAAFCAAEACTFSDGLAILQKAYHLVAGSKIMAAAGISAIIGLSIQDTTAILEKECLRSICHINSNNEYCHIFCGEKEELEHFNQRALEADAINAVTLDASLPYHHPLLSEKIKIPFTDFLKSFTWHAARFPIISTRDQSLVTEPDDLIHFTADHLCSPINWSKTVERIYKEGCTRIVECGPGISLTQNARFISGKAKWINSKNIEANF